MNPLLLPWALRIGGVAVVLIGLTWGVHSWKKSIYEEGYNTAKTEAEARERAVSAAAEEEQKKRVETEKTRDRELRLAFDTMSKQRYEQGVKNAAQLDSVRTAARDGSLRLSIDVSPGNPVLDGTGKGTTNLTPGLESGTKANVLPRIADDVFRIAGNSAEDVRAFNELLTHYRALETRCKP
jgi:hypothetical protein